MAGIYIHIPFCKQACIYCNFHFSTILKDKSALLEALCQEMELRKDYLPEGEKIDTLYFGGGTPSILSSDEIKKLIRKAETLFDFNKGAEITLEGNPDDLSFEKLKSLRNIGINRLSVGIQSFFEAHLKWMNRAHDEQQAKQCVDDIYHAGFEDFSIDLIFGVPGMTDEQWLRNIDRVVSANIPHVSCYGLTVEPTTVLNHLIRKKKMKPLDEAQSARQYEILMDRLEAAGYEQYEISNFAKPGMRARHNSSYWQGIPYLGIGPGAHSYRSHERQWNISNNARYIKAIMKSGEVPCEKEELTPTMQWDEYIMTRLRTIEGCSLKAVSEQFGEKNKLELLEKSHYFEEIGELKITAESIFLTRKGRMFGDQISAALFKD